MRYKIPVSGMHCRSCEVLLEGKLENIGGVNRVKASQNNSALTVDADDSVSRKTIESAIKEAGYEIRSKPSIVKMTSKDFLNLSIAFAIVALGVYVIYYFQLENIFLKYGTFDRNLTALALLGLIAGISTCMALVGGLVLSVSARYAELHSSLKPSQKFIPHIYFNLGRLSGFFVLGGLLGLFGSSFKLSITANGMLAIIVSVVMMMLGLQIINVFPNLNSKFVWPKFISRNIFKNQKYSHLGTLIIGAMTFFLPCGFTQTAQIIAVSTGSFIPGALVMLVFAIGTMPGLLLIGGLTSIIKEGKYADLFYKIIGLTVIALAVFSLMSAVNLVNINNVVDNKQKTKALISSNPEEVQLIKSTYDQVKALTPDEFTVKSGRPVRLEIYATEDGAGCMGTILIPGYVDNIQEFKKGEVVRLEFTPEEPGMIKATCAMGITAATFKVIE